MIKSHLRFAIFEKGLEGGNQVGLCDLFADSSLGDINNYTFQNIFYHLNHQHDEYLQFCEFVSDHVAHSPGLILSTLSQGWHHLWNFDRKLLNINTKIQMITRITSCSTSSVWRREAMDTQASTARSLTES